MNTREAHFSNQRWFVSIWVQLACTLPRVRNLSALPLRHRTLISNSRGVSYRTQHDKTSDLRMALRSLRYGERREHGDLFALPSRCDISITHALARLAGGRGPALALRPRVCAWEYRPSDAFWRHAFVYPGVLSDQRDRDAVERSCSVGRRGALVGGSQSWECLTRMQR
jgi:hypothetical protein